MLSSILSGLIFFQIFSRPVDFNYKGFTDEFNKYELKSKEIQKEILGDGLYDIMEKIDNKIPFNF
jgi:hypothetical protein